MEVLVVAISLQILAGAVACALSKWPRVATTVGSGGAVLGCLLGLFPTLHVLLGGAPDSLSMAWDASHGAFCVEVDALGAFFLLPVFGLSALAAVYGSNYMLAYRSRKSLGCPWFFFNVFVVGMVLVVVARTTFLFLVAWEAMSIAAYFLVTFEHEKDKVRKAGWVYLIATHLGVAFLSLAFVLLGRNSGSLEFAAFRDKRDLAADSSGIIFLLALVGFGAKAGFVPFHVWAPEAYPAAPSHVSAVMSGAMSKLGFYGILRVLTFLGEPAAWWGLTLAGFGILTAIIGISLSLHQRDIKRVLAYSSIENMGLIGLAFGVSLWGWASGLFGVAVLGMTAGLLHIWNHSLMKGLLFFTAGNVFRATGTEDMEQLGGLLKRMPVTGTAMMVGALAIAALPPLNGFASKWLVYLSVLKCGLATSDGRSLTALFAVGLLAMVGSLAGVAFVRLTGIVLLGSPRSEAAGHARESSAWMLGPMLVLFLLCFAAAVVPQMVADMLAEPLTQILGPTASLTLQQPGSPETPLYIIGNLNAWILLTFGIVSLILWLLSHKSKRMKEATWGCAYARPTERMQYTGRSFAEMIAEHLLPRFLRASTTRQAPRGLFPGKSEFESASPDPISEKVYDPFFRRWAERFFRLRILQQGLVHVYLIYILVVVVLALAWVSARTWWTTS
ncbi:proton-conducting transporter membrane subunit [soil metagenome]